jgi:uncharacterized Zn-binding protein involved in type VI secretion
MPAAARLTDDHTCPYHGGGPVSTGATKVFVNGLPAARVGDQLVCGTGVDTITEGSSTVNIEGKAAARKGDKTDHCGALATGSPNVNIGSGSGGAAGALGAAAKSGTALVEMPTNIGL